jgi:hypothetical protein
MKTYNLVGGHISATITAMTPDTIYRFYCMHQPLLHITNNKYKSVMKTYNLVGGHISATSTAMTPDNIYRC